MGLSVQAAAAVARQAVTINTALRGGTTVARHNRHNLHTVKHAHPDLLRLRLYSIITALEMRRDGLHHDQHLQLRDARMLDSHKHRG
jgi:hypothetical protein